MVSKLCDQIFDTVINQYHILDTIEQPMYTTNEVGSLSYLLYKKCWIDTVQWHMEDIIRNPAIDLKDGMDLKRRIDKSNQERTDTVEMIDDHFFYKYNDVDLKFNAKMNSESPAWLIDRVSILTLKIYHMNEETLRTNISIKHLDSCRDKLVILKEQHSDLMICLDDLIGEIQTGVKRMKVYRQMKMYNDENLNPVLYMNNRKKVNNLE
ncbi:hypothetical protein AY601_2833 [Pedobacter cryoconitis]|uniref:DUF4254 domain-containing protein n=1 Tax=Pedobacter cryoconitis TaxID=188932 RepID=A0A127VEE4_9SPHI|nr:DUF4254 domain-containing protein [Pedobacter cryoconitis]AMP99713.1 hypothetical protein AY601_2833 [Pedobacter cryoconitis]